VCHDGYNGVKSYFLSVVICIIKICKLLKMLSEDETCRPIWLFLRDKRGVTALGFLDPVDAGRVPLIC
jgi:hypothetical protein